MKRDILVMGANIKALRVRIACMKKHCQINNKVYLLGNDSWTPLKIVRWVLGKNTMESLQNFKKIKSFDLRQVLVISGWYHLLRCWLILHSLGFKRIRLVPSTWRLWETPWETVMNEARSLREYFE